MAKGKGKKVFVQGSMTAEAVLELDQKGEELIFDPSDLISLDEGVVRGLGAANRQRYLVTREIAGELKERNPADDAVVRSFGGGMNLFSTAETAGSARQRLQIKGKNPNFEYRWVRPDMIDDLSAKGWEVDVSGELKTFRGKGKGPRTIRSMGMDELVVVRIPKERHKELRKEKAEKREKALRTPEAQARRIVTQLGSKVVDDSTPFTPLPAERA